jgi:energy-coupling factor transporter ATP-binding protein EcfA2
MLAIARALMARPKLLLLDEPSMGLAPQLVAKIFAIVREIAALGVTILLVEQNARLALEVANRGYVMESARLRSPTQPATCSLTRRSGKRTWEKARPEGAAPAQQGIIAAHAFVRARWALLVLVALSLAAVAVELDTITDPQIGKLATQFGPIAKTRLTDGRTLVTTRRTRRCSRSAKSWSW